MKKIKRLRKSKKGMTLVELVVAITLISIVFASAMSAIVHGYMSVVKNKNVEQASMQAKGVADTVVSAINDILADDTITDKDDAIIDAMNGSTGVSGLKARNSFLYYDGIKNTVTQFPNTNPGTGTAETQVTIEKISNVGITKSAVTTTFNGYKVYVAVPCANSYNDGSFITVTATSMDTKN